MLKSIIVLAVPMISLNVFGDCFQEVAQRAESGLIPGVSLSASREQAIPVLLNEIKQCTGLDGLDLWGNILENYCRIEARLKPTTQWEYDITLLLASGFNIPNTDAIKIVALKWYQAEGALKKEYYNNLCIYSYSSDKDKVGFYDYNYTDYKAICDNEPSPSTELSMAILDYMFTRSPGLALITMNSNLSNESVEELKVNIGMLVKYHRRKDPRAWSKKDLSPAKDALNSLISSNYAYIDLFIAEIVNVVHDLRTPEVDTFLAQSTHPLVIKRLQHPFVYEPLVK